MAQRRSDLIEAAMTIPLSLDTVRQAPKALLHDHLDGGLRVATVLDLADECDWTPNLPTTDPHALQAWFTAGADSSDLLAYLATFEHTLAVMQRAEHLERVAYEAVTDLAADGVVYAEIRFAPELHQQRGLALEAVIEAVATGVRRGEATAHGSIAVNLIVCAMRTEQRSVEIVELVQRMAARESKVVGFDLAGAETGFPPSLHAEALAIARRHHLNVTLHASEPPDLELISDAIAHGAHRIGHGVRLDRDVHVDDHGDLVLGPLARHVLDRRIHLEMAPTCNVQIGAAPSLEQHPIGRFLRAGFRVSVNTDNRLMSHVMPSTELWAVAQAFDLNWTEVEQLVEMQIMDSFAPWEQRRHLVDQVVRPAYTALGA
jgi:adenosine deaminase